ncbi:homoserine O-acetyltransferase [Clavulina sp. PMI_390]|nr:homoserine O-acetyltransferase [Clavulina sp. PMI_390]
MAAQDKSSTPGTYSEIVDGQTIVRLPEFTLESGRTLRDVPVAFKTWGKLNATKDNVMIICHALTGSADVDDWWGPLMGPGKAFDPTRYFIFCGNVMGSPYGSASPLSTDPETGKLYGPEFPLTTIRDDVRVHKLVLDQLGVASVAVAIGGSMGGMTVLEWPLCFPGFVHHIVPLATSARHSAWCISWGEAQRQSIYSDPLYLDGYYDVANGQPKTGLAAARMAALLTYRSRDSFESRFGRKTQMRLRNSEPTTAAGAGTASTAVPRPSSPAAEHALAVHNDGHKSVSQRRSSETPTPEASKTGASLSPQPSIFTAQSYLRYQGDKFTSRFDANCYIHISRKLDTHDLARGRINYPTPVTPEAEIEGLHEMLGKLPSGALVISIQTDGLFTPSEQHEIATYIPDASLITIPSPDGHDGFLLEFEAINRYILEFLHERLPELYSGDPVDPVLPTAGSEGFEVTKASIFGEAEGDITQW